ncbi:hypothetical protein [uncultured Shewanella sp.]|uniref:hypothetical protein n=1 Tax=uncultured Shewanella sp. TaxID=173975 RepID=UPI002633A4C9|nr:hypothetical protein [uncultured Shewanella sp.]
MKKCLLFLLCCVSFIALFFLTSTEPLLIPLIAFKTVNAQSLGKPYVIYPREDYSCV